MTVKEYNNTVKLFSDQVYRFILKTIKDEAKAQDIIQDSYEKLWLNRNVFGFEKAKAYLFTTAYRTMIDAIRKDKRLSLTNDYIVIDSKHEDSYNDIHEILNLAVNHLPEDQRSVILLRDFEGYSYDEIAKITGLNEDQVKVYIYRARLFLKNYIGKIENVL
jgi:RNA polymerase sigma factor (sigma-70 family)